MYNILKHAHSGMRWVALGLLLWAIVNAFQGWQGRKAYTDKDLKIHKFGFIGLDIQLLLGFILYGMAWGTKVNFANMKDALTRFYTIEHLFMMLIAIALVHIGFARSKKVVETPPRFRMIFISYLIALLIILAAIPWPFTPWNPAGGWG